MSATEILDKQIGGDEQLKRMVAEETVNAKVAQAIYDLRTQAGLAQGEMARSAGTTQPVIARLEDADYTGHSLRMLIRIAGALGRELDVRFVDSARKPKRSPARTAAR